MSLIRLNIIILMILLTMHVKQEYQHTKVGQLQLDKKKKAKIYGVRSFQSNNANDRREIYSISNVQTLWFMFDMC